MKVFTGAEFQRVSVSACQRLFTVSVIGCLVLGVVSATAVRAGDAPNPEEDRLRAALRQVTEQLQSVQSDLATAQANQAAVAQEKTDLQAKYAALAKRADADKSADSRKLALLEKQVSGLLAEDSRLTQELTDTQGQLDKMSALAKSTGVERDSLKTSEAAHRQRIATLEAKNVALFMVANEILNRYQDFSFRSALKAKEPFVGSTRAHLETLVQDYQDKILDARDRP